MSTLSDAAEDRYDTSMSLGDYTGPEEPPVWDRPRAEAPGGWRANEDSQQAMTRAVLLLEEGADPLDVAHLLRSAIGAF
jgi:hypothetical protein